MIYKLLPLMLFLLLNSCVLMRAVNLNKSLCSGKNQSLSCLKANFDDLYQKEYYRFFKILYAAEKDATSCKDAKKTAEFLGLSPAIKGNAEVAEYFSEIIEKKFVQENLSCFLKALSVTEISIQTDIIKLVAEPIYLSKDQILDLLEKQKSLESQYGNLINQIKQGLAESGK